MRTQNTTIEAFFALVRAGLWETDIRLSDYEPVDFAAIQTLAEDQSVDGLVAAGLEHVVDQAPEREKLLHYIFQTLYFEKQNTKMNAFIGKLVNKMQKEGIHPVLLKGQGIAQCYERPLWRICGDVDFFLSEEDYQKAKAYLIPKASHVEGEYVREKHLGMDIGPWVVELHGSLYCGLSSRIEKGLEEIQEDVFSRGGVRYWMNGDTQVSLPSANNDAVYVFTHILQHFYKGGIGVRQICDWVRLLWTYRKDIDLALLERRLKAMGLITEWKAFGSFAVEYLGMPVEAMPLYSPDERWKRKAGRICSFVIEVGNMGQNRDKSYFEKYPYVIRKAISLGHRMGDLSRHARIFPLDSLRFFPRILINGIGSSIRGE